MAPFNLELGSSIDAKVVAVNQYGDSTESLVGSGAIIYKVPDSPINLRNVAANTKETLISIEWSQGVSNGNQPVLDYRLWYKLESAADYTILSSSLLVTSYTTDFTLLAGQNYQFKV